MEEAVATQASAGIAVEVYKDVRQFFGKKINYANDFEFIHRSLTSQKAKVLAKMKDVQADINRNQMMQATSACEDWISKVMGAEQDTLILESKYNREIKHAWRFIRLRSRINLSKQMAQKCQELNALIEEGNFPDGVVAEGPPEPVIFIDNAPRTEDYPSLHENVENILGFLRDKNIKRIGLSGTVGIGKTTVMQNLNNSEEVKKMFEIVIWVSVSKEWSKEKVQDEIKRRLKLEVGDQVNMVDTARRISNKLGGMRYLLLLDDVWDFLDLHEIGIPNNNNSRVVFASRIFDLCRKMNADELVSMGRLSEHDAYKMFEGKVGQGIINSKFRLVAEHVVRECCHLPLLIAAVAGTFKHKNIGMWRRQLKMLQSWPDIQLEGLEEVLKFLQFCYVSLDEKDKKDCFLYGALFAEECDISTSYLMECWMAEGFLCSCDKFRDACDRGHMILNDLINLYLLENGTMKEHVRMNKVIRAMALNISSQDHGPRFLVRTRMGLREAPKEEEWASVSRISLMDNEFSSLPATPNCINLSTLLLQRNCNLKLIQESFFSLMQRLRVLDLHESAIESLPSSLSCLTSLRALYLNSCTNLFKLPPEFEALLHLVVLDIRRTRIIPTQINCLMPMRCLRMSSSNFDGGNLISKVISSLSLLEELIIDVDPNHLWSDQVVSIIMAVSKLTRLNLLTFSFPNVEDLQIFTRSNSFWKDGQFTFQFSVGICNSVKPHILDYFEYQSCSYLKYANGEGIHTVISEVLSKTNVFELIDHKSILHLSEFGIKNISELRACSVEGCELIKHIIDGNAPPLTFKWLERMVIKNAPSLICICNRTVPVESFRQMISLTLCNCPKLEEIFSNGLIKQLAKLEHLSVEKCYKIEEIVIESEDRRLDPTTLPRLKKLVLRYLPKLRSITPDDSLIWPSLGRVEILSCPFLSKLPSFRENAIIRIH